MQITSSSISSDFDRLGAYPLIVKPAVSYASVGITDDSVVYSGEAALAQYSKLRQETRAEDPIYAEVFLEGREFTALVVGGASSNDVVVYPVAERVFDESLPQHQRFLAFNRYWQGYTVDSMLPSSDTKALYHYALAPEEFQKALMTIAEKAYRAVDGVSYGRVDIRSDKLIPSDDSFFVLEVNSQASFSFEPSTSSMADILALTKTSPETFLRQFIQSAILK